MSETGPPLPLLATATSAVTGSAAPSATTTTTVAPTSTVPSKKRIRAVVACSHCRSKRSKCDGIPGRQACTECQQRGIDCEMTDGKRNRGHYKPQAEALAKKVRLLEEALARSQATNQELLTERQQLQGQVRLPDVNGSASAVRPHAANVSQQSSMRMDVDNTPTVFTVPAAAPVLLPNPSTGITVPSLLSQSLPATSAVTSTEPSTMPPPQSQNALQRTAHNPTLLVMDHGHIVLSRAASPVAQQESNNDQQSLPIETTTVAVGAPFPFPGDRPRPCCCADLDLSPPLVDYLLGLFFHRYQMMLKFVSQEDFMRKHAASSSHGTRHHHNHSPLFLAMLAAGVRYSTRPDVTARFLLANGENKLATAARQAVEIEVGRPTLATVQTVLILCEVETTLDHQMTGYMYSCLASKMIYGMGIDLSQMSPAVRETMSAEETAIRHWLIWSASIHDQFWSVFLRMPLAIKNEALQASRMAWRSTGSGLSPMTPAFEDEVNDHLMDLMILAREITNALYGLSNTTGENTTAAGRRDTVLRFEDQQEPLGGTRHGPNDTTSPPSSPPYDGGGLPSALYEQAAQQHARRRRPDVTHLDARLDNWFNSLPDRVRQGPTNGHSSYHYLFILHLHYNATKIMLHRTRAFSPQAASLHGNNSSSKSPASVPVSSYPLQSPVTPPASSSGDANTPGLPPPQSAIGVIDHATAQSIATLGRAAISMARLFESFRRREDIRMLQCTGVQWAGMASESLTWYIETLPIDGAIEAVAHLQSLARTLKDMAKTFRPAVYPYDRTNHAIQMFQMRMESNEDSPRAEPVTLAMGRTGSGTPMPDLTWAGHGYSGPNQHVHPVSTPRPMPSLHGASAMPAPRATTQPHDPSAQFMMSPGGGMNPLWSWADQDPWDWNDLLQQQQL